MDLTYKQFLSKDSIFLKLLSDGYQKIDNLEFNHYLKSILRNEFIKKDLNDIFVSSNKKI